MSESGSANPWAPGESHGAMPASISSSPLINHASGVESEATRQYIQGLDQNGDILNKIRAYLSARRCVSYPPSTQHSALASLENRPFNSISLPVSNDYLANEAERLAPAYFTTEVDLINIMRIVMSSIGQPRQVSFPHSFAMPKPRSDRLSTIKRAIEPRASVVADPATTISSANASFSLMGKPILSPQPTRQMMASTRTRIISGQSITEISWNSSTTNSSGNSRRSSNSLFPYTASSSNAAAFGVPYKSVSPGTAQRAWDIFEQKRTRKNSLAEKLALCGRRISSAPVIQEHGGRSTHDMQGPSDPIMTVFPRMMSRKTTNDWVTPPTLTPESEIGPTAICIPSTNFYSAAIDTQYTTTSSLEFPFPETGSGKHSPVSWQGTLPSLDLTTTQSSGQDTVKTSHSRMGGSVGASSHQRIDRRKISEHRKSGQSAKSRSQSPHGVHTHARHESEAKERYRQHPSTSSIGYVPNLVNQEGRRSSSLNLLHGILSKSSE